MAASACWQFEAAQQRVRVRKIKSVRSAWTSHSHTFFIVLGEGVILPAWCLQPPVCLHLFVITNMPGLWYFPHKTR